MSTPRWDQQRWRGRRIRPVRPLRPPYPGLRLSGNAGGMRWSRSWCLARRHGLRRTRCAGHACYAWGVLGERDPRPPAHRGRGRPARTYALTDAGRSAFPHAYDDLANTALRYLRETGGEDAVRAFAEHRAAGLVDVVAKDVQAAKSIE